jgi:hypothetical protein
LFAALSLRVSVPLRIPVAVGVKVTLMLHVVFAAKLLPQVLV